MKVLFVVIALSVLLYFIPIATYFKVNINGSKVSLFQLIKWRFKGVPLDNIVSLWESFKEKEFEVDFNEMVNAKQDNVDLNNVFRGMKRAHKKNLHITFSMACKADKENIDLEKTVTNKIQHVGIKG